MKILKLFLIAVLFVGCKSTKKAPEQVTSLVNPKINLPKYKISKLANGLEVLYIQDKKLPLIQVNLLIPAGYVNDPAEKQGLAYMTGRLLKMGSNKRSAQEISESFEQKGSSFSLSVDSDYVMIAASALSKYTEDLFTDIIEVVTQPKFSWPEYNRLKSKIKAQNIKGLDNASGLISNATSKLLFPDHPYGFKVSGTSKTINKIERKDVLNFYKNYYQPKGATIAIVGDYNPDEMTAYLDKLIEAWPSGDVMTQPKMPVIKDQLTKVHLVHKPGAKQSQIRFGHMGIARNNKDFIALRVANAILGQGFSSRLLTEVRVKKGLTYTIRSSFNAAKSQGPFVISTFTRHDKVKETIDTVFETVKLYLESGVTDEELQVAKQYLKGTFPRALETSSSVAYNIMLLKHLGVPLDYLNTYISEVDKITKEEIKRVANEYIHPEKLQIIVLSDKAKVVEQLKEGHEIINYQHTDFN